MIPFKKEAIEIYSDDEETKIKEFKIQEAINKHNL
jgi:hypothetical protein